MRIKRKNLNPSVLLEESERKLKLIACRKALFYWSGEELLEAFYSVVSCELLLLSLVFFYVFHGGRFCI